jgi:hypothetical protein
MDSDIYQLVEKILRGVGFIAIGGTFGVIFFLIFAQSILGSKKIQAQLEKLMHQAEQIGEQLKQIARHLEKTKDDPPERR